jgi:hypothetical protein
MKTFLAVSVGALMLAMSTANASTNAPMENRCKVDKQFYRPSYCDKESPKLKGLRRDRQPPAIRHDRDDDIFFFIPNLFGKIVDDTNRAVDGMFSDLPNVMDD